MRIRAGMYLQKIIFSLNPELSIISYPIASGLVSIWNGENKMREIYGGDWNDLGEERIRRYPSKVGELRTIYVKTNTWKGLSSGSKHWYVEVKEKDNMWWDEKENAWREIYDDSEKGGYSLQASVMTEQEAIDLATHFIKTIHPDDYKNQDIVWDSDMRPIWATRKFNG